MMGCRPVRSAGGAAALLPVACALAACLGGDAPPRLCFSVEASPDLNFFDGQSHAVALRVFPLASSHDFDQSAARDFLAGSPPQGVLTAPFTMRVSPGETQSFDKEMPRETLQVVVVADYYRAPGDADGTRLAVLPPACGFFGPSLVLGAGDLEVQ